jgi:tetratricopeptide (TPR) repeat protein
LDQLTAQSSSDIEALEAKIRVQVARGDFAVARETAARIIALRPDRPSGVYMMGLIAEAEGKRTEALAEYEKALKQSPDAIQPLSAAVRVDLALQQPARAMARLDAVLVRSPKNAVVAALKQYDAAVATFERAIALQPTWWVPYRGLALSEVAAGRAERGIAAYQRGAQAARNPPILLLDLAALQEKVGRPQDAMQLYEAWLARSEGSLVARNNLAMLLIRHRSDDRASLDRALELVRRLENSSQAAMVDTYGWVLYARGEYAASVEALRRVVAMAPGVPIFQVHLGLAQFKAGQRSEAKRNLTLSLAGGATFGEAAAARAALAEL